MDTIDEEISKLISDMGFLSGSVENNMLYIRYNSRITIVVSNQLRLYSARN